jgi:hypothetical protein
MGRAVYVFTAAAEDDVAFSLLKDGSNLPRSTGGDPWEILFRAEFSEPGISMFQVKTGDAYQSLCSLGHYVGPIT